MTADGWVNLVAIVISLIGGSWIVGHKLGSIDTTLKGVVETQQEHDDRIGKLEAQRA